MPVKQVWPGVVDVVSWASEVAESVAAPVFDTEQEFEAGFGQEVEKQRVADVEPEDARVAVGDGTAEDAGDAADDVAVVSVAVRIDAGRQPGERVDYEVDSSADCSFRNGCSDKVIVAGRWQPVGSLPEAGVARRDE